MKKNRTMRIAAVMLVFALITTCIISGSFAKYVTEGTAASDEARVAAWGVTVEADSNLEVFKTEYELDDTTATVSLAVEADENVVAPGTKNEGAAMITLRGTPEVAVEVAYTGEIEMEGWEVDGDYYCPIIFTIDGNEFDGQDYGDIDSFIADVSDSLYTTEQYDPNTDLSDLNEGHQVSWEWPFDVDDEKDTALGDAAAEDNAATISISLNATVTQID